MEIFYYTLGILSVLIVIGIFGMVRVWNKISENELFSNDMESYISDTADDLSDELDKLQSSFDREIERVEKNFEQESHELGKMIDSRLDKFDNHLHKKVENLEGTIARIITQHNL
tara:strand:+ start:1113 stop:1457 length:345 start_codon:yes stop_codon:yes gene_type:complete